MDDTDKQALIEKLFILTESEKYPVFSCVYEWL